MAVGSKINFAYPEPAAALATCLCGPARLPQPDSAVSAQC